MQISSVSKDLRKDARGLIMTRCIAWFVLLKLCMILCPIPVSTQPPLQEMLGDEVRRYMLHLSGTVLNKSFQDVQAMMTLSVSGPEQPNPYRVDIIGFPQRNERNVFTWFSHDSYMTYFPGTIRCDVKHSYLHEPEDIHFYYASPDLYERQPSGFYNQAQKEESERLAGIVLEPTRINAQAGRLEITLSGNRVSGRVWIKGYDNVENSYVQYNAAFIGRTVYDMDPRYPAHEPQPMHILEDTDERYR